MIAVPIGSLIAVCFSPSTVTDAADSSSHSCGSDCSEITGSSAGTSDIVVLCFVIVKNSPLPTVVSLIQLCAI